MIWSGPVLTSVGNSCHLSKSLTCNSRIAGPVLRARKSQRGKGCGGKQDKPQPGQAAWGSQCTGDACQGAGTPERKEGCGPADPEGNRSSRGKVICWAQSPSVPPMALHWDFIRSEGLALPGVWCRKESMSCPQMKVTLPCSPENANPLTVTRNLGPQRAAESAVGEVDRGHQPRL